MKKYLFYSAVLTSFIYPTLTYAMGIEASAGFWNQDPSGYVGYKVQSEADKIDVNQNLGYGKKTKPIGRVKIDLPLFLPNIYFMATPMKFDGTGKKDVNFTFGGKTYSAQQTFYSEVKADHYDIALYYGVPFLKGLTKGVLNIEVGPNIRVLDLSLKVQQGSTTESKKLTVAIPMLYVGAQVQPTKFFKAEGEFRGISYNSSHYYDFIGRLKVYPYGPLFLAGGYRYEELKVKESDVDTKLKFKGPFVEAGFEF
ncbi:MAG: hypothetical protein C0198_07090 [Sulfurihydrogenibium sp.]|nr:MAG: hypothetical protein C0198_07090 [Sulfurihydrogenibium sp.]